MLNITSHKFLQYICNHNLTKLYQIEITADICFNLHTRYLLDYSSRFSPVCMVFQINMRYNK